jgi:hypothetical protein
MYKKPAPEPNAETFTLLDMFASATVTSSIEELLKSIVKLVTPVRGFSETAVIKLYEVLIPEGDAPEIDTYSPTRKGFGAF